MIFHVINVYKPPGMTSHDVVARLRRIFSLKRVGHMGTLDPAAEGVLPLCLGYATRLIEYFPSGKAYRAEITLGITTTTLDQEGEELSRTPIPGGMPKERIREALSRFVGTFDQQVPMHSAVHVEGKKLYELAHQGITVETPFKPVTIHSIELVEMRNPTSEHPVVVIDVDCGSGTYIRSLARDVGNVLGCGAHLSKLIRTRHGRFELSEAVPLEVLAESENPHQYLLSPIAYSGLPEAALVAETGAGLLANGMPIPCNWVKLSLPEGKSEEGFCLVTCREMPLAVAKIDGDSLRPVKVFPRGE